MRCPRCSLEFDAARHREVCPRCALAGLSGNSVAAAAPASVAGYELVEEIGRGGMGAVWLARQPALERFVALKLIPTGQGSAAAELEERLVREGRAAARLRHPGIVHVLEIGRAADGTAFLAMDFVEGGDLAARLRAKPFAAREAAELLRAVALALAHAHGENVLHRDLKPSNILLDADGRPRLADFGLAAVAGAARDLTRTGHVAGTPAYLAPEVLAGHAAPSVAADLYALGAVLYEMLTGRAPFHGDNLATVMRRVLQDEPPAPRALNRGVPRDLETICLKCLEKRPAARYATALELADELERFLDGRPIRARPLSPAGRLLRWSRRNPALAAVSAALLGALLAGTVTVADRNRRLAAALDESRGALQRALVAQATAVEQSGKIGQRHEALALLRRAAAIAPDLAARNAAVAALARPDLRETRTLAERAEEESFGFDPAGGRYAAGLVGGGVRVLSFPDGAVLRTLRSAVPDSASVLWFSPDRRHLGAAHFGAGRLEVWDERADDPVWSAPPAPEGEATLAFHPSDGWAYAAADRRVLWHGAADDAERELAAGGKEVLAMAFAPRGDALAIARDDVFEVREFPSGALRWAVRGEIGFAGPEWSHDGTRVAWSLLDRPPEIVVSDARDGRRVQTLRGHRENPNGLAFHPDGVRVASVGRDLVLHLWDVPSGEDLVQIPGTRTWLGFTADGRGLYTGLTGSRLGVLELAPEAVRRRFVPAREGIGSAQDLDASPDGRFVATATLARVRLWRVADGRECGGFVFNERDRTTVFFHRPDELVCHGHTAGTVRVALRELANGGLEAGAPVPVAGPGLKLSVIERSSGDWWFADRERRRAVVWPQGEPARARDVTPLAADEWFCVDAVGARLGVLHQPTGRFRVVAAASGATLAELPGAGWRTARFSPDGRTLLLIAGGKFEARRTADWSVARRWESPLAGRAHGRLVFSPDGRRVALLLGADGVELRDAATFASLATLPAPAGTPDFEFAWSRDGARGYVLSSGHDLAEWNFTALRAELRELGLDWPEPAPR